MEHDPIELAAIDRGAGSPVAFVHGGIIHGGPAWAKNMPAFLDAGFRVIAVDRRGHGRSAEGDADHVSVHLHADDLRLTLELREARPAHLVGVSYGCLVCLEFALSWPDRVQSLTLLEPAYFTLLADDPDFGIWVKKFQQISDEARGGEVPLTDWIGRWLSLIDARMSKGTTPDHPSWTLVERQAHLIFKEEAGWEYSVDEGRIDECFIPTLVINGDQSEPPMQVIGEELADMFPMGQHHIIRGAGHDAHFGAPDEFNDLVLGFVSQNDRT